MQILVPGSPFRAGVRPLPQSVSDITTLIQLAGSPGFHRVQMVTFQLLLLSRKLGFIGKGLRFGLLMLPNYRTASKVIAFKY